ncbi:hypothetical protein C8Q80DRAFT_271777 [Daedaleopsis nitida]|nr:hypothetical protein C8Q80DRAFT_271777 [Daedaleopsis nitida]
MNCGLLSVLLLAGPWATLRPASVTEPGGPTLPNTLTMTSRPPKSPPTGRQLVSTRETPKTRTQGILDAVQAAWG